jgi:hypothetical protein
MKSFILLLLNLSMNIALYAIHPSPLGILPEEPQGLSAWWMSATELWAIPLVLLFLSFNKSTLIRSFRLIWGLFNAVLCGALLGRGVLEFPQINWMGKAFLSFELIVGLSLALVTIIEIHATAKAKAPLPLFEEKSPKNAEQSASANQNSAPLRKVEGF